MILEMSRCRKQDVSLQTNDPVAQYRRQNAGYNFPFVFSTLGIDEDPTVEKNNVEIFCT